LLESAALLGHLKEVPVVNEKGEPTGKVELIHDGEGGMVGYHLWLGKLHQLREGPGISLALGPIDVRDPDRQSAPEVAENRGHKAGGLDEAYPAPSGTSTRGQDMRFFVS